MKKLKVGSVFSGIGSFEQALKKLNIEHDIIFACDNDKFVKDSYFANYDISLDKWYNDIYELNGEKYKNKLDILVGGSPCQSFSSIGFGKGLKDETQPNCFIFENVKGLLTNNKGKTWDYVLKKFKQTGYKINYQLMNAKDYGIPQS